jgi:hypothetical protein
MTEFEGDLWVTLGHSDFGPQRATLAELVRIHPDGTWELVVGIPRIPVEGWSIPGDFSDIGGGTEAWLVPPEGWLIDPESVDISATGIDPEPPPFEKSYPIAGNPCDFTATNPACFPSGNLGAGLASDRNPFDAPEGLDVDDWPATFGPRYLQLGLPVPEPFPTEWHDIHPVIRFLEATSAMFEGASATYLWQLAVQGDVLYGTTNDNVKKDGFDLYRTTGGPTPSIDVFVDDGLGNPDNRGGRVLVSTPYGLIVGTSNEAELPEEGGAEVWLGVGGVE